ncbi:MAG: hypothetical protein ACFFAQ_02745 [Promethearchaeota archaeon]
MIEDSALSLKKAYEKGENVPMKEAQKMLEQSELISKLLETPKRSPDTFVGIRAYEWRLLELSEIPFTKTLEKVQSWLKLLIDKSYIKEGFSLEGTKDNLLACHNALITTILLKMDYDDKEKIDAGIDWILKYQSIERGKECTWPGADLYTRFGGCMKKIPCYYGVVKSMNTLTEYKKKFGASEKFGNKLNQGLEYILKHRVYKKLSSDKPIESSIILNFYPYTYRSNIIEILSLLKANGLIEDERCKDAIQILKKKQRSDGFWQADISYMKSAWIDFDIPKKPGLWISYIISGLVNN